MAAPLDEFQHKLLSTVFACVIPAMIVAGVIGVFKRDVENWIVAKLRTLIHGKPPRTDARQDEMLLDAPPCCPDCRRPMLKRKARRGDNRGSNFWGCPTYPACRGTRTIS